ncbi:C10 family peptidase [Capnocytophaga canis]|uniref:C10 family peptidase n=1 Tax=Capnocytophaga canis TaxID=1848903 RepID=UPI0015628093|nr:C10 family peptidase [Capnocytophaga canis]
MKKINTFFVSFIIVILFIGCSQDSNKDLGYLEVENIEDIRKLNNLNYVDIEEIKSLADSIFTTTNIMFSKKGIKNQVREISPIRTKENKSSIYIVNYENGGFFIMPADKRIFPILAYSNDNNFDLNTKEIPPFLIEWLQNQNSYIADLQQGKIKDSVDFSKHWNANFIENYIAGVKQSKLTARGTYGNSPELIYRNGPLTITEWGQGEGYNNMAPNLNCLSQSNGRALTGCVATAMAQIMKFHNHPNSYNWSIMPNKKNGNSNTNSGGFNEISKLMRDAGNSVNMNYGCENSGAITSHVANALKSPFSYKSAIYTEHDILSKIENEIKNGYPVILRGGEEFIFNGQSIYTGGHAWVCDGYQEVMIEICIKVGRWGYDCHDKIVPSYYMNFGWDGLWNGWYLSPFKGDYGTFDYKNGIIYNIRK